MSLFFLLKNEAKSTGCRTAAVPRRTVVKRYQVYKRMAGTDVDVLAAAHSPPFCYHTSFIDSCRM